MRLIDADALKADYGMKDDCAECEKELCGTVRSCEYERIYSKMDFCGWIDDAPTIEAVEVVRCKDCKYWQDQEVGVVEVPICARHANKYEKFPLVMLIGGDGYCSYAERRTDE